MAQQQQEQQQQVEQQKSSKNNKMPTAISVGISNTQNENELKIVFGMSWESKTKAKAKQMTDNQLQCNYERGKRKGEVSESAMFEIVCWASASSTSRQKINRVSRYLAMRLFIVFLPATPHLLLLFSCCCCSSCNCSWNLFSASFRPRPRNGALEPQTRKAIDAVPCIGKEKEREGRV